MPIFDDPPSDLDETWTHGALLGGMVGYAQRELAASYFRAADTLIDAVASRRFEARDVVNPVLYLFRHGIELYLKAIVYRLRPMRRTHDLRRLASAFREHVRKHHKTEVLPWFMDRIAEFGVYDPHSDVFRYDTSDSRTLRDSGELWVDLAKVQRIMTTMGQNFERVILADYNIDPDYPG